jgi:hypothetical protein
MSCETLTTEGLGSPEVRGDSWTFPGATARVRFDVTEAQMTVRMLLRLKSSA